MNRWTEALPLVIRVRKKMRAKKKKTIRLRTHCVSYYTVHMPQTIKFNKAETVTHIRNIYKH